MKATSPAEVAEQGGKFIYFLKRYFDGAWKPVLPTRCQTGEK